jgi:RNA polymerase sigma-70 factor (ECF subfamily)
MHIYDGMKVSEISRQLGEGYKSVEYRLGTARKVVRAYLSKAV